ncbi:hypothetical protein V492_00185 [Pseudogymnoascus sp. VKM F-4246]|nr:hypothetical protein V492_00185 [Pseudogymnoascus sp. VKM F-4246]
MDTTGFNSLLDACPKLEWLSYMVEARPAREGEIASITPMEAQQALITKARTLKGLELRFSDTCYSPLAPRWLRDTDLLLSLKKMTALEKLILDECQLLVHKREDYYEDDSSLLSLLPTSIQSLQLAVAGPNFPAVMRIAKDAPDQFPRLKVVTFEFTSMVISKEEITTLRDAFSAAKIQFFVLQMGIWCRNPWDLLEEDWFISV